MAKTAAQRLEEVEAAITNLLAGTLQSYSLDGRTVTKLDMATLYDLEKKYRVQAERETSGNSIIRRAVIRT